MNRKKVSVAVQGALSAVVSLIILVFILNLGHNYAANWRAGANCRNDALFYAVEVFGPNTSQSLSLRQANQEFAQTMYEVECTSIYGDFPFVHITSEERYVSYFDPNYEPLHIPEVEERVNNFTDVK